MTGRADMEKKTKTERSKLVKRLGEMAYGRANDAVRLAISAGELSGEELDGLDLTMLSEVKRGSGGAVEVKLINRLEVIKLLLEELRPQGEGRDSAAQFFAALENAARSKGTGAE